MKKIISIAVYTFIENLRNKIFYVLLLFGAILVGSSLLLAALGGEQSKRILLDMGIGAIELFSLITIGFASVTLVLEEMESKTIYLILTRPVSRINYLLGRFIGLLLAVYSGMIVMAIIHLAILHFNGWDFSLRYFLAVLLSAEKILIMGSLTLFLSLFSTSAVSSMSFMIFFWLLGHFSEEINFLSEKVPNIIPKIFAKIVYYLVPNFQYFNIRDFWDLPQILGPWIALSFVYGIIYSVFFLLISLWIFKNKEF